MCHNCLYREKNDGEGEMGVEGRDVSREGERHKVDVGRVVNIAAVWLDESINDYIYIIRIPLT